MDNAFRIDLLVERTFVVELKSTERDSALYPKQLLTYLRLMGFPLGLLMNFGQETFKQGVQRVINSRREASLQTFLAPLRLCVSLIQAKAVAFRSN